MNTAQITQYLLDHGFSVVEHDSIKIHELEYTRTSANMIQRKKIRVNFLHDNPYRIGVYISSSYGFSGSYSGALHDNEWMRQIQPYITR